MDTSDAKRFEEEHPVGFLQVPEDIGGMPLLSFGERGFVSPKTVYTMDYCLPTDDQGSKPWCAAYSAAGFAENILWRKTDVPQQIDPTGIYEAAKKIDGNPNGDGTTLDAVLKVLLNRGTFDPKVCKIRMIRDIEHIKYAIHKYGCCLAGFNISREWYRCNKKKPSIFGEGDTTLIGGHAVLICGMDRDGIYFQNSWGEDWGWYGIGSISYAECAKQFLYGAVLDRCLYDV